MGINVVGAYTTLSLWTRYSRKWRRLSSLCYLYQTLPKNSNAKFTLNRPSYSRKGTRLSPVIPWLLPLLHRSRAPQAMEGPLLLHVALRSAHPPTASRSCSFTSAPPALNNPVHHIPHRLLDDYRSRMDFYRRATNGQVHAPSSVLRQRCVHLSF